MVFDHTCIGFFRNRCELAIGPPTLETSNQIQGSCTLPVLGSPISKYAQEGSGDFVHRSWSRLHSDSPATVLLTTHRAVYILQARRSDVSDQYPRVLLCL